MTRRMDDYRHQTSMYKLLLESIFILFGGLAFVFAQNSDASYRVSGAIVDQDSAVIPGLGLVMTKDDQTQFGARTDINGHFEIGVSPGNYEVVSTKVGLRLFLKISDKEPNPQNLELTINSANLCKSESKSITFPKVLKSVIPLVPAAAKAVRAVGEVSVQLSVGADGKVISAQAVSGHPLLRSSSEIAAKQFEFETASGSDLRTVIITFVFLDSGMPKRQTLRYECPYRVLVEIPVVTIDVSDTSNQRKSKQ